MARVYLNKVCSSILFYTGWVICLQEASQGGYPIYGPLLILGVVTHYLYRSICRKADYILLALVLCIGPLSDMIYAKLGLFQYRGNMEEFSWIPPLWVFFLWGLFGVNIHLFSWLKRRWLLAIFLGALGGALSYLSAFRLGGAYLLKPLPIALITIGGTWAIFLPYFIWLSDFLNNRFRR